MHKLKGRWLILALSLVTLLCTVIIAPWILKNTFEVAVKDNCKSCELKIGGSIFNVFTGKFTLTEIEFKYEEINSILVQVYIKSFEGEFSFLDLIRRRLHLYDLLISEPKVILTDIYDLPVPPEKEMDAPSEFKFKISNLDVKNASFSYVNKDKIAVSRLDMSGISGNLLNFGNTPDFIHEEASAHLEGRIEKSGHTQLDIRSKVFERPVKVEVEVKAGDQNLNDLTSFFKPFAGISLKGNLLNGYGRVRVLDRSADSEVFAKFNNFDADFSKRPDRSSLATFFMNLGETITLDNKNTDKSEKKSIRRVHLQREKDESLPGFILRSLKEAAIEVAKK